MPVQSWSVWLQPNKTYQNRRACLFRYTHEGFLLAGILEVVERKKEGDEKATVSRFLVQELKPEDGGRRFRLLKPKDPYRLMDGTCYYAHLKPVYMMTVCTCRGFEGYSRCKHVEALVALASREAIPPLRTSLLPAPTPPKRQTVRTPSNPGKKRKK